MQTLLFPSGEPAIDVAFSRTKRVELGRGSWLELQSGWLRGHEQVFEAVRDGTEWVSEKRWMYEREVEVPRLVVHYAEEASCHPILARATEALSARYRWPLTRMSACYYRDGRDSVADHSDRMGELRGDCVIAIVSLGSPRRFTVRPVKGGRARHFELGWGDLVVMGGSTQEHFLHGVPKQTYAEPRISIQFRPAGRPDVG